MFNWIFFLTRQSFQDKPDIQLYIWCKLWLLPYTQYRHHSRQTNFRFSFVLVEGRNKITYQHKQQLGNDSSLFQKEIQGNNSVHWSIAEGCFLWHAPCCVHSARIFPICSLRKLCGDPPRILIIMIIMIKVPSLRCTKSNELGPNQINFHLTRKLSNVFEHECLTIMNNLVFITGM